MSELENEVPRDSPLHPDNIGPTALVTLLHIKDYLSIIANAADKEATDLLEAKHDAGEFLNPVPILSSSEPTDE